MNIILASSEVVPFAKTGGLADVCGALPRELRRLGHQVTVFMPAYRSIDQLDDPIESTGLLLQVPVGNQVIEGELLRGQLPHSDVTIFFVRQPGYFDRDELYGENGQDYEDNCQRFVFFCRAVLESIRRLSLSVDLIHANDWQTGLIPALLKTEYDPTPPYANIASLLTIHNLAYQGLFPARLMAATGIDGKHFNWQEMEFYGSLNLLKTGIVFADAISTVSPTYAREIQTDEQGYGLQEILRQRRDRLFGILNGIDGSDWNPATDPLISTPYDAQSWAQGKAGCKAALQQELGLPQDPDVPLIGIVGRLAEQKGWSLITAVMNRWLGPMEVQWAILGTGQPAYHTALAELQQAHPRRLAVRLEFSNRLAHQIEAGADLFLMPSQYEPCGLNQMYSMAYGTVPVVRKTGGLADTVVDCSEPAIADRTANGFCFEQFEDRELETAIQRALDVFHGQPRVWQQLVETGMNTDWSWKASAARYTRLYEQTLDYFRGAKVAAPE